LYRLIVLCLITILCVRIKAIEISARNRVGRRDTTVALIASRTGHHSRSYCKPDGTSQSLLLQTRRDITVALVPSQLDSTVPLISSRRDNTSALIASPTGHQVALIPSRLDTTVHLIPSQQDNTFALIAIRRELQPLL
jgi:hypothetical protein